MTSTDPLQAWLLGHGFPPDGYDAVVADRTTPLMRASYPSRPDIVRALIDAGVALNSRNADGNNALWLACVSNDSDTIDALIAAGIDLENRNDNEATSLMYAASSGKANLLEKLLTAGALLHHQTLDGFTALDIASTLDCLRLLRGADQNRRRTEAAEASCVAPALC